VRPARGSGAAARSAPSAAGAAAASAPIAAAISVRWAGKKFLQDAPLPPAKRAELKKMLDEYLTMQAVLG